MKTKRVTLKTIHSFLLARTGRQTWEVTTTTSIPFFSGEVTEHEFDNRHGGYTTDELVRPGYFFGGWEEAGYKVTEVREEEDDKGLIYVELRNGPIIVTVKLVQYA